MSYKELFRQRTEENGLPYPNAMEVLGWADTELARLRQRTEKAERERDDARQQAQIHAQEARTQTATVNEIYQAVTGWTGEPGDWHGAQPVVAELNRLRQRVEELEKDRLRLRNVLKKFSNYVGPAMAGEDDEVLMAEAKMVLHDTAPDAQEGEG